jgi:hypothetical protein
VCGCVCGWVICRLVISSILANNCCLLVLLCALSVQLEISRVVAVRASEALAGMRSASDFPPPRIELATYEETPEKALGPSSKSPHGARKRGSVSASQEEEEAVEQAAPAAQREEEMAAEATTAAPRNGQRKPPKRRR